jgi:ABC-type bacteriocin/lantibiotic exporter with double-glycine peptidase domain
MSKLDRLRVSTHRTRDLPKWAPVAAIAIFFVLVYTLFWLVFRIIPIAVIMSRDYNFDENGVILQRTDFSCAACSMYMLLRDEGMDAPIWKIAWVAHTNFGGTQTKGIMDAGEAYGFDTEHVLHADFDDLMSANVPMIVMYYQNGYPHAVYAKPNQSMEYIVIKNPGNGLIYSRRSDFGRHFSAGTVEAVLFIKE